MALPICFIEEVNIMAFRSKMSRRASKRDFSRKSSRTNSLNSRAQPMRGGFRI